MATANQDTTTVQTGPAMQRGGWNWTPAQPVALSPLFSWPPQPASALRWLAATWALMTVRVIILAITVLTWFFFQPALERCRTFEPVWILEVWGRNLALMVLVAGGLHLFFYSLAKQGKARKYDVRGLAHDSRTFFLRSQVLDNMFWTLASGVTVWTAIEVLTLWGFANGYVPTVAWADNPIWFVAVFLLQPIWGSFHFYCIHRLLHWPPLYRLAHAVHHRNVQVGPWSGMSMHPVEHILYLSSGLIHWLVASHPIHFLFHMQVKALEAATSHTGFESVMVGGKSRLLLGDFFHHLHHRYFECNYGTLEMPWDRWFGSFHDGTQAATLRMRERRKTIQAG